MAQISVALTLRRLCLILLSLKDVPWRHPGTQKRPGAPPWSAPARLELCPLRVLCVRYGVQTQHAIMQQMEATRHVQMRTETHRVPCPVISAEIFVDINFHGHQAIVTLQQLRKFCFGSELRSGPRTEITPFYFIIHPPFLFLFPFRFRSLPLLSSFCFCIIFSSFLSFLLLLSSPFLLY
jgi:hypothetical protein